MWIRIREIVLWEYEKDLVYILRKLEQEWPKNGQEIKLGNPRLNRIPDNRKEPVKKIDKNKKNEGTE